MSLLQCVCVCVCFFLAPSIDMIIEYAKIEYGKRNRGELNLAPANFKLPFVQTIQLLHRP